MALSNKQIILRQPLSGNQITININNNNYIKNIKEEISKINNLNVYNLIINQNIYLCFELDKIKYDDILEIPSPLRGCYYAHEIPSPLRECYYAREIQIINIVFLNILLVDIIVLTDKITYNENDPDKNIIYNLNNVNLIIYLIKQNLLIFKYVNSDIKNNFEIVKLVVQIYGLFLEYASEEFQNNFEIVKLAVQNDGYALKYASNELKNNFEIVKIVVQKYAGALRYASDELKNNFEIVKIAVQNNGYALRYASDELKNNIDIVKLAIQNDKNVFKYASNELRLKL
jgi:hypothetical protein